MGLTNAISSNINSGTAQLRNPFSSKVEPQFSGPDFERFTIEEILPNGDVGDQVLLIGNMMPKDKIPFGGSQRIQKNFYSGYIEPSIQILGSEETDITITGEFKDKRYTDPYLKGVALEISLILDLIRLRGNIVRIQIGDIERYGIIQKTAFDLVRLTKIPYSITFSIIGFKKPTNAIFLQSNKEFPFAVNKELIEEATLFQANSDNIPDSVPRNLGDLINGAIGEVAGVLASVTGFVDQILNAVDIKSSINRALGLVKYAQNRVRGYKALIGGNNAFDLSHPLDRRYNNARFYSQQITSAQRLTALLEKLRKQLSGLSDNLPLGKHLVVSGDSLQKISVKFYGNAQNWKRIYDYNNLTSTELVPGKILEIPRL